MARPGYHSLPLTPERCHNIKHICKILGTNIEVRGSITAAIDFALRQATRFQLVEDSDEKAQEIEQNRTPD